MKRGFHLAFISTPALAPILALALWLPASFAQSTPGVPITTLRNSFVVAAETVVDNADSVDVKADPAH